MKYNTLAQNAKKVYLAMYMPNKNMQKVITVTRKKTWMTKLIWFWEVFYFCRYIHPISEKKKIFGGFFDL